MEPDWAALRRFWPNREHDSNWVKAMLCACRVHRWHTLTFEIAKGQARFDFCRWCPEIRRTER